MRKLKKSVSALAALTIAIVAGIGLTACGGNSGKPSDAALQSGANSNATTKFRSVDEIKRSGSIKLGVFVDKSPFGAIDQNGQYAGYDIEYANELAKSLGVKAEFVPTDAVARVSSLEANKVDVVLANFTVTAERAEKVDFTLPYMKVALGLVSKADSPVESLDKIGSKKVVIVKGTTAETFLEKNYPEALKNALRFEQYAEVQNALADGRADAWLTDNTEALAFAKNTHGFVVPDGAANIGDADQIAPAVAKGNTELRDYIDKQITELTANGFFKEAYTKTLAPVYGEEFAKDLVLTSDELVTSEKAK